MDSDCVFCDVLRGKPRNAVAACDTILAEFEHFVLVPTVGPLSVGHVLLLTREHLTSLSGAPRPVVNEYLGLVATLRAGAINGDCLEFEHGSLPAQPGRPCIDHVHIHLIPDVAAAIVAVGSELPRLDLSHDLSDISQLHVPYILLRNRNETRAYMADSIRSQYGRRKIWEFFGRNDWDWATYTNEPAISATVLQWKSGKQK